MRPAAECLPILSSSLLRRSTWRFHGGVLQFPTRNWRKAVKEAVMLVGHKPRLSFESLEMRSLLSGMHAVEVHGGGTMNAHVPAFVSTLAGAHAHSVTNLRASLSDPTGASDITGNVH